MLDIPWDIPPTRLNCIAFSASIWSKEACSTPPLSLSIILSGLLINSNPLNRFWAPQVILTPTQSFGRRFSKVQGVSMARWSNAGWIPRPQGLGSILRRPSFFPPDPQKSKKSGFLRVPLQILWLSREECPSRDQSVATRGSPCQSEWRLGVLLDLAWLRRGSRMRTSASGERRCTRAVKKSAAFVRISVSHNELWDPRNNWEASEFN
jgi:hypothetical protein